jgi:peptide chain release factor subunit 1
MITIKQIEELMKISSEKYPIVSFYLGTTPQYLLQKKYRLVAKDLIKSGTKNLQKYDDEQKEFIEKDTKRILQFVNYDYDEKSRGIAIFASQGLKLWQVYLLPRRLKGRFIVDTDPYTRPLVRFFDENEKYFLVLVNKKRARLFSMYTGIMNERKEVYDEVMGRHKKGGWSQARFQRHIKNQAIKHFQNVSTVLDELYRREKFDHLILGGTLQARTDFKNIIRSPLQKIIVGEIEGGLDDPISEIQDSTQKIIDNFENKQSKKYLKTLFDRLGKKHLAVSGLDPTVKMLNQARVHTLIVKEDLSLSGFKCFGCETPYTTSKKKCELCNKKVVSVPDIVDEIIEKTWEMDGEVKFIKTSKELDKQGGIGALLRW